MKPLCELQAREDYSRVFPVRAGELWPFVGDLLSGSRVMDGGAIFSPNAQNKRKSTKSADLYSKLVFPPQYRRSQWL